MKKYKFGFTLAEVLICVAIMGIIVALSVHTLKIIKASYASLAYFEFNNIRNIAGELIAGKTAQEKWDNTDSATVFDKNIMKYVITADDEIFCEAIYNLVNSSGKKNCSDFSSIKTDTDPIIDINNSTPNFITTNGRRYYISKHVESNSNVSDLYGYRIIGVDLNGTRAPNISSKSDNKIPDIVSFMILDNGEIFPVGIAADNLKVGNDGRAIIYINSRVKGYYFSDIERSANVKEASVPPECTLKTKDGDKTICNFAVVNVPKMIKENEISGYSYREAYCTALGQNKTPTYKNYCKSTGLDGDLNCPPSNSEKAFDLCSVENIKPMFRYNFN